MSVSSGQVGANGRAINKGTILKLSVDHIKELREEVYRYQERIKELERMVEAAKERKALSQAAKNSDQKVVKLKRLAKQLGSEQHPKFEDRHLQRLRPNPGNKIQKKPVSGANGQKP